MNPAILLALLLTSCVAVTPADEAAFITRGHCTFGGISQATDDYCAQRNFGTASFLAEVNQRVISAGKLKPHFMCKDHVYALQHELATLRPDLRTQAVFSAFRQPSAPGYYHASLMVTDEAGTRYVVDNGAVFDPIEHAGSVGTWD